jgi:peptide/nickel transport system permease protein
VIVSERITQRWQISNKRLPLLLGVVIVLGAVVMAIFSGLIARYGPEDADASRILLPPSSHNWLGTDINGSDIFSRIVWGARIDLTIALVSTLAGASVGTAIGVWSGFYFGRPGWTGWLSDAILRFMDVFQAFPIFVLALALVSSLGRNIYVVIYALIALQIPIFVRLARSAVLHTRQETYIESARCAGNSELRLILFHVLPNSLTPTLVNGSVVAGQALLLTAGLSFVGAGVPAPTPEWGYMVAVGAPSLITGQWWAALFPGAVIGIIVLGFALVGDGIRAYLDPTTR